MRSDMRSTGASPEGIDYFGRGHWLTSVQERVSLRTRRRIFDLWTDVAGDVRGQRILDVGATPDRQRLDSNCMLPWFLGLGMKLSLYSPEDIAPLKSTFPSAELLPSVQPDKPLPAKDRSYDWVCSSAVLEHVGSEKKQIMHIAECGRVASALLLTTPNRYHWLEFHTKLPFVHWFPRGFHRALLSRVGKDLWAHEEHLRLLGRTELLKLARLALQDRFSISLFSVWTLGMPSNLVLIARR